MRFYKWKPYKNKGLCQAVVSFQLELVLKAAGALR